jgi:hypothetical protein
MPKPITRLPVNEASQQPAVILKKIRRNNTTTTITVIVINADASLEAFFIACNRKSNMYWLTYCFILLFVS